MSVKPRTSKGQTSALLIVIVLIIFGAIAVFMLNISRTLDFDEYTSIYTDNLLFTMLRTDTGFQEPECKLVSDLLACAYLTPQFRCGNDGPRCLDLAEAQTSEYMSELELVRKNYDYLFLVEPEGFISDIELNIGNERLDCRPGDDGCDLSERFVSNKIIQKGSYILKASMILARK